MLMTRKWKPNKRMVNYNSLFVIMFWTGLLLGLLNIIGLTTYIFMNPSDARNVLFDEKLYLGFYEIHVLDKNIGSLTPWAIVLSISVIVNTLICIITYWSYRNSRFLNMVDNVHVSSLLIIVITFIIFLFIVNVFNRPIIDYKNLDIIKNGWNTDVTNDNYITKFNYVYDIHLINDDGTLINTIFVCSRFFYIWVILICIFWILLFVFIVALFYNSNVSISIHKRIFKNV